MPLSLMDKESQASRVWHTVNVLGRLRPGVDLGQARADMETISARLSQTYPATNRNVGVLLTPLREQLVGSLRPALLSLMGCVVLVLLIACVNVANLLLVRASAHRRETAVRQALGASRLRLLTQYLAETFLLCLFGGLLGTVFAALILPLLRTASRPCHRRRPFVGPINSPRSAGSARSIQCLPLHCDLFRIAADVSFAPEIVRGIALPATVAAVANRGWKRGALVSAEVAIAIVVLFLGSLLVRSFQKLIQNRSRLPHRPSAQS